MLYFVDLEKALEIGRPPDIMRFFPISQALTLSRLMMATERYYDYALLSLLSRHLLKLIKQEAGNDPINRNERAWYRRELSIISLFRADRVDIVLELIDLALKSCKDHDATQYSDLPEKVYLSWSSNKPSLSLASFIATGCLHVLSIEDVKNRAPPGCSSY